MPQVYRFNAKPNQYFKEIIQKSNLINIELVKNCDVNVNNVTISLGSSNS
jgi:hypothetical protein